MEQAQEITKNLLGAFGYKQKNSIGFAKMAKCLAYQTLQGFQFRNWIGLFRKVGDHESFISWGFGINCKCRLQGM